MRKLRGPVNACIFILGILILITSPVYTSRLASLLQNSDFLFPISIFKELSTTGKITDWIFGGYTPYLELLIGWGLWCIFRNMTLTFVGYTIVQYSFVLFSLIFFWRSILGKKPILYSLCTLGMVGAMLLYASGYFDALYVLSFWYLHVTTACLALIALGALIRFCTYQEKRGSSWRHFAVCCVSCVLAAMSDALFLPQFVVPAVIVILALWILSVLTFRKAAAAVLGLLYSTAGGLALFRLPVLWGSDRLVLNGHYFKPSLDLIVQNGPAVLSLLSSVWDNSTIFAFIWDVFYLSCIFLSTVLIRNWNRQHAGNVQKRFLFLLLFFPFQAISSISANLASTTPALRYVLPLMLTPYFWSWPIVGCMLSTSRKIHLHRALRTSAIVIFAGFSIYLAASHAANLTALVHYYPESIQCIDENVVRYDLRHGLAQYWVARPISLLSRSGLTMSTIGVDLSPNPILNSSMNYRSEVDFIVADTDINKESSIEKGLIIQKFGQPALSFQCGGNEFLVYNRPSDANFRTQFLDIPLFVDMGQQRPAMSAN